MINEYPVRSLLSTVLALEGNGSIPKHLDDPFLFPKEGCSAQRADFGGGRQPGEPRGSPGDRTLFSIRNRAGPRSDAPSRTISVRRRLAAVDCVARRRHNPGQ